MEILYDNLKTGDLVFTSGTGLAAGIIKKVTDSEITHVGFVLDLHGVKFIVEMQPEGVVLSSFKKYLTDDKVWIEKVCRPTELTDLQRNQLTIDLLFDLFNMIPYDFRALLKFVFKRKGKNEKSKLYCSEKVYTRLNNVIKRYPIEEAVLVSPADLSTGDLFPIEQLTWKGKK